MLIHSLSQRALEYGVVPIGLSFSVVVLLVWIVWQKVASKRLHLPVEEPGPGPEGAFNTVQRCYEKYLNTPYVLNTSRPVVVLPPCCVEEVKNMPESKASMYEEVFVDLTKAVTQVGGGGGAEPLQQTWVPAIRMDLTRRLNSASDVMLDEFRYAMAAEYGKDARGRDPAQWAATAIHHSMTKAIALVNSRIFVGRPLSRTPEWLEHVIGYTVDVGRARHDLNHYPYYLRLVIGPFLPSVRTLKWHLESAARLLTPVLQHAVLSPSTDEKGQVGDDELHGETSPPQDHDEVFDDKQGTFCSWLLKYAKPEDRNARYLAINQLAVSFVSMHTSSFAVSRAIYDLCAHPECVEPMRKEIEEAMNEDGVFFDGECRVSLKKTTYPKLRKLDSFLKESMRMSPSKTISLIRVTKQPVQLSTGHRIPANTRIGLPIHSIHTSPHTPLYSPDTGVEDYVPPDKFDGFRYEKLRRLPGNDSKYQFAAASNEALGFSLGAHCCPGRFYAATLVKTIFAELVRCWDVRFVGDTERRGGAPPAFRIKDFTITTDPGAQIEIRRRPGN